MTRISHLFTTLLLLLLSTQAVLAVDLPERPDPPRLVNDFAGILDAGEAQRMEDSLEAVARSSSNQIAVVTVSDLQDLEPWDYAVQLGRKWGIGGKEHNNGVIILIKPTSGVGDGRVTIQVGYGLEGALPDGFCHDIIENEMKPSFGEGDYEEGLWAALKVIIPTVKGEYNEKAYYDDQREVNMVVGAIVFLIIAFLIIGYVYDSRQRRLHPERYRNNGRNGTWGGPIYWGGGSSSSSDWGGSGGWGGGGFDFGGGSFGGGGASGSF